MNPSTQKALDWKSLRELIMEMYAKYEKSLYEPLQQKENGRKFRIYYLTNLSEIPTMLEGYNTRHYQKNDYIK